MAYRSSKKRGKGRKAKSASGKRTKTLKATQSRKKGMYFQGGGKF